MLPLSLYVHIPWCVKKCPYCDFNSHQQRQALPEQAYIQSLKQQFLLTQPLLGHRPIETIFIGGGTPSLFHPKTIAALIQFVKDHHPCKPGLEVTMEANPGTTEHYPFEQLLEAGVNRLSLGIQSFNESALKSLGRIHSGDEANLAIHKAKSAGFDNINLDLMYGLPQQSLDEAMTDLQTAIQHLPAHLSWYQLTIEPHTAFYFQRPKVPKHDLVYLIEQQGQKLLTQAGYQRYEISAYSRKQPCLHNLNYWHFGDYCGIGAGAHSKITTDQGPIRFWAIKHPNALMASTNFIAGYRLITKSELPLEFMMNRLRLLTPIDKNEYQIATTNDWHSLIDTMKASDHYGWITMDDHQLNVSKDGRLFIDEILTWL